MLDQNSIDRRDYLTAVGAAGTTTLIAGCTGDGGEEDSADDDGGESGEAEAEVINPGTAPGFPPFEYTEDGELVGFDIDLAEAAIERAGYQVGEWTELEFDSLIPSLTQGNIDMVAAAMTITPDRNETIDFSDPYYEANQSVLLSEENDISAESLDDLEGLIVGAQSGTTGEDEVDGLVEDGTVPEEDTRQYDNYTLAVEDLESGNVDAIILDIPVAENFADGRAVTVAFEIETGESYGFGFQQGDSKIADINDALQEIQDDGTYDDLVSEYFA